MPLIYAVYRVLRNSPLATWENDAYDIIKFILVYLMRM
jgi:hypothetical protein